MPPTVFQALRRAAMAVSRSGWLGAVGLLVTLLRTALFLPGQLFLVVIGQLAAGLWLVRHGGVPIPGAAAHGVRLALSSPRFLATAGGLWLAAALVAMALRVAYLAGALPTLAGELAGSARKHRFAAGFVRGFLPLLPTAIVATTAELLAGGAAAALLVAGAVAAMHLFAVRHGAIGAAAMALAACCALLLYACTSALCDAATCRAALRAENAAHAFGRAALRFGHRPAAFLSVGIAAAAVGAMMNGSIDAVAAIGAGAAASRASIWLAMGPQLMMATLGAFVAAVVDLWRLASTAVLACHSAEQP